MRYQYSKVTNMRRSHLFVTRKKFEKGVGNRIKSDTVWFQIQLKNGRSPGTLYLIIILFYYIFVLYINLAMKVISLNLDEIIFSETEKIVSLLKRSRNGYINEAIEFYNRHQRRMLLEYKLQRESDLIKDDSMNVLKDFEEIDYGD